MIVDSNENTTATDRTVDRLPRGIRNRNPGNIRRSGDRWKGLAARQSDPEFCVFEAPLWGIRAMAVILRNYQKRNGLKSVAEIIGRWAPASENDTTHYVAAVGKTMGVDPHERLDLCNGAILRALIAAIIHHENGLQPYDLDTIDLAIDLA
jgi:hypothetical protein